MIEISNDTTRKWWVVVENTLKNSPLAKFVGSFHRRGEAKALADERNKMELAAAMDRPLKQRKPRSRHYVIERTEAIKQPHLQAHDAAWQAAQKKPGA